MLETLSRGFRNAKARLTGVAELTPDNIEDALRDVRMSLLEADVEFKVTKTFLDRVKEKAIGETVKLRAKAGDRALSATPEQHFIRICQEELVDLMGPVDPTIRFEKAGPTPVTFNVLGMGASPPSAAASEPEMDHSKHMQAK